MKKYKNAFEYICGEWVMLPGGAFLGLSFPMGTPIFGAPLIDFMILFPTGFILLGLSAYYKFYKYR